MRPAFPATRSVDSPAADAKHSTELRTAKVRLSNEPNLIVREFAGFARHAIRLCAVALFVSIVLFWCSPSQIFNAIVGGISVIVSALMRWARRRANKDHKNCSMGIFTPQLAVRQESNKFVAGFLRALFPQSRPPIARRLNVGTESAKRANRIAIRKRNRFPNFARKCICIVSHCAVPLRRWSGPGAVTSSVSGPIIYQKQEY